MRQVVTIDIYNSYKTLVCGPLSWRQSPAVLALPNTLSARQKLNKAGNAMKTRVRPMQIKQD